MPPLPEPMLSRLSHELPSGDYAFEIKWDGFRAIVSTTDGLRVRSRRGWDMSELLPELGHACLSPSTGLQPLELANDFFRFFARERAEGLRVLGAIALELEHDLHRKVVVRRAEDLDDVIAPERHVDADQLPSRVFDHPLAFFDALAPAG